MANFLGFTCDGVRLICKTFSHCKLPRGPRSEMVRLSAKKPAFSFSSRASATISTSSLWLGSAHSREVPSWRTACKTTSRSCRNSSEACLRREPSMFTMSIMKFRSSQSLGQTFLAYFARPGSIFNASFTKSPSDHSSGSIPLNASGFWERAARAVSRSFRRVGDAYFSCVPSCLTAARTTSGVSRMLLEVWRRAEALLSTAARQMAGSSAIAAEACLKAEPFCITAARTTSRSFRRLSER
mmetsp:Transcript_35113/g.76687  ORF Transcript_35113/g.76687 Transcript_35113/m.76687 type:complete len:241 (-) Transcript_35113:412-1134(-)